MASHIGARRVKSGIAVGRNYSCTPTGCGSPCGPKSTLPTSLPEMTTRPTNIAKTGTMTSECVNGVRPLIKALYRRTRHGGPGA